MNADYGTALRTLPAGLLPRDKPFQAQIAYDSKIFNHAHAVPGPVTLVQLPQARAGELGTFRTERLGEAPFFTAQLDPAGDTIPGLIGIVIIAAQASILLPEIANAETAIHPAGGNHSWMD
jgi:hypothetical protein